jgi:FkbM family methyltransferase
MIVHKTIPFSDKKVTFDVRPNSTDHFVLSEIYDSNCYGIPESGPVIDIGGNIGAFTILSAALGFRVLTVEAEADNFLHLSHNVTLNGLDDQVYLVNKAIGRPGVSSLFVPVGLYGNTAASEVSYGEFVVSVPALTMDEIFDLVDGEIGYLKVDIEGGEYQAFKGLSDTNMRRIKAFGMEYHGSCPEWGELMRRLTKYHDIRLSTESPTSHLYGGLCLGIRR